jgi:cytochrome b involved in lipid metabolism
MTLIGVSILIATFTIFLFKVPPSTWFAAWFPRKADSNDDVSAGDLDQTTVGQVEDGGETKGDKEDKEGNEGKEDAAPPDAGVKQAKAELDRKAMPPPPSFLIKPPSAPSNGALPARGASQNSLAAPSQPSSRGQGLSAPALPAFPALNSAQRASDSRGAPRLNPIPSVQPPLRSVYSASPPGRSPAPNRGGNFSLAPPPTHSSIPPKPRLKVGLTPGHSPLDWAKLSEAPNANLRGLPADTPYLKVTPSQLRHYTGRKGKDAWTVLGGKVYNIMPYLPYHPGGEPELMKCAGRDGTKLFAEIHPWVNWEGMLGACLVGIAVGETEVKEVSALESMD